MSTQDRKQGKYRPVLTQDDVKYLAKLLKRSYTDNLTKPPYHPDAPNDTSRGYSKVMEDYCLSLTQKFSALDAKINNSAASPAYVSKGITAKEQILEDLGGTLAIAEGALTPGERRRVAYTRYTKDPDSCTPDELADALEYRFQNSLMSPSEASAYEAKMWETLPTYTSIDIEEL